MSHKLFILMDLEGIIGVENLDKNNTLNINAELDLVLRVSAKNGYKQFVIANIHNTGMWNFARYERTDIEVLCGLNEVVTYEYTNEDVIMIGFHPMNGKNGRFPHSFRPDIKRITFDSKEIGEVGIYSRWFLNKGLDVKFISGEGDFKDEVPEFVSCHSFDCEEELSDSYTSLEKELVTAFSLDKEKKTRYDGKLTLELEYNLLFEQLYDFEKQGKCLVCNSIEDFLDSLERLAHELNRGTNYILEYNLGFIKKMRLLDNPDIRKKIKGLDTENILEKDILTITQTELDDLYLKVKGL